MQTQARARNEKKKIIAHSELVPYMIPYIYSLTLKVPDTAIDALQHFEIE